MTLVISTGVSLSSSWLFPADPDAAAYVAAVEAADGQTLETATKAAIDNFVIGCKADGIWSAIKASCIMAGARTLAGALVPLKGTAPTNFNFVAGDYDRKTGLKGKNTAHLNSNRSTNDDPATNVHLSAYVTQAATDPGARTLIGAFSEAGNSTYIGTDQPSSYQFFARSTKIVTASGTMNSTGLIGLSRSSGSNFSIRIAGSTTQHAVQATGNAIKNYGVLGNTGTLFGDQRASFYSIGGAIDLALLDARVTGLMNDFAAVIP